MLLSEDYLAEQAGFPYWSHQANRRVGGIETFTLVNHAYQQLIGHVVKGEFGAAVALAQL